MGNIDQTAAKRKTRTDALQERLRNSKIVVEDAQALQDCVGSWFHTFRPQNYFQRWLLDEVAIVSLRIDRVDRIERRERDVVALRAEVCWDSDRQVEVELLGARLADKPSIVVEQLKTTPHGCDWLIKRWSLLAYAAERPDGKGWDPEQVAMAFDMLGTPANLRIGRPGLEVDDDGRLVHSGDDPAAVARRQIARLKEVREQVAGLDETARFLAASDLTDSRSPEIKQLRRYESSLHRRLRWLMAQFKEKAADPRQLHPTLRPKYVSEPDPVAPMAMSSVITATEVEVEIKPIPEPIAKPAPIPCPVEVPPTRREVRIERAESRRMAKRRKLERILA